MAFDIRILIPHLKGDDVYVALAGGAAFLCVWAIGMSFAQRDRMSGKIRAMQERRKGLQNDMVGPKKRRKPETSVNFMRAVAIRLQLIKKNQVGKTQSRLIEAGFRSQDAIYILAFFNLLMPILLALIGSVFMKFSHPTPKWHLFIYVYPVLGAYVGLKLPGWYVGRTRKIRYRNVQRALSDVLDLMTICAEAGLSLAAMLDRVSRELVIAYPEMAEELGMTAIEIGFLPDRNKALSNLYERCQLPEIRGIVSVLIQTEKYGTPSAQALRVLSSEFRQARMLRAEQKAARLPALMTVPMIVCILPTLFIVIISPAVVKLMHTM
jgi:tight adherence protein C